MQAAKTNICVITLLFVIFQKCVETADSTESKNLVTLQNGSKLKGISHQSVHEKRSYLEFRGIPYAKPPTGELRFRPSKLFDENLGSRDATEFGKICPQLDPWYDPDEVEGGSWDDMKVLGDEDCLYVNVATPDIKPTKLLPVLVWFSGGNFQTESGQEYGLGKLMDQNLVAVTFNYRLGPLGYLNAHSEKASGNMGLKDQTTLLKWVRKNIHSFGGDPNMITVAGSNAGAVSIHLHMLSPMSENLFHKAIIQSGTAISPWVLMKNPKEKSDILAKLLKCDNKTDTTACILEKDATTLIQQTHKMTEWFLDPMVPFGPSIEMTGKMRNRFLTKSPYRILQEGDYWAKNIPVVMGVNSHEGLLYAMDIGHQGMLRKVFNMEWFRAAPVSLYYKSSALDHRSVSEAVRHYYFPLNKTVDPEGEKKDSVVPIRLVDKNYKFDNLTQMYSDRHFFIPLHHSAKLMGKVNRNVYLYWFDYLPKQSIHGLYGYDSSHIFGPSHYDQIQYLFVTSFFNETTGKEEIQFERELIKGLYNFVKDDNIRIPNWISVSKDMVENEAPLIYNRIGRAMERSKIAEPFTDRVRFWSSQLIMEYDKESMVEDMIATEESKGNNKDEL